MREGYLNKSLTRQEIGPGHKQRGWFKIRANGIKDREFG